VRERDAWTFAAGWSCWCSASFPPLHALGGVLFSAHMAQHELLMTVATPTPGSGQAAHTVRVGAVAAWRRITGHGRAAQPFAAPWRALTHPATAFLLHAAAIWVWHLPSLYDATVSSEVDARGAAR
jgi:cytochrome c oxidase assembly factor CtaG